MGGRFSVLTLDGFFFEGIGDSWLVMVPSGTRDERLTGWSNFGQEKSGGILEDNKAEKTFVLKVI
jgi:hypothetical protein